MIRCLIVDDEPVAHEILEHYILQTPDLMLAGKVRNPIAAFAAMHQLQVDLLFLDINMPLMNGLDFLKSLKEPPAVVLTTAYAAHALEGFELDVVDYLLKPFSPERFERAVSKVRRVLAGDKTNVPQPETAVDVPFLMLKGREGLEKVTYSQIRYIEAAGDYMKIYAGPQPYLTLLTMKELEQLLLPAGFVRIHRSFLVACSAIRVLGGNRLTLTDGTVLPVSQSYRQQVMTAFRQE
ncbi:LytR/AlgR family response regulator transcription factor [Chitinophaga varians]|uniref:LytR/AlgR family response regulator transcription factor n=1 Tax=Chitinophaga varians TaxID=2202339 RepID=UPI001660034C|nr:LytTR family DNA-binding domain-containing protein [Chitinophaga varians]MBC9915596.1 response regulator transcription factor [Chitinophaga varians]